MMNRRQEMFVEQVQNLSTSIVAEVDRLNTLGQQWDEEFRPGASNAIVDDDLAPRGITVTALGRIKTFATAMNAIWTNQVPVQAEQGRFLRALMGGYR